MEVDQMNPPNVVYWLSLAIAVLAIIAAGAGLFWRGNGSPYSFTTLRGTEAQMYGQGLYRHDTLFIGAGYKGQDAVVLFIGIPLLILATVLSRRGSLIGHLLLLGVLGYFLYVYASMCLGAAYNRLFLIYVALLSASLFAFVTMFSSVDAEAIKSLIDRGAPQRSLAIFWFASGLITIVVWGVPLVAALIKGGPPDRLDSYTTPVTYALDLAIITPATIVSGILILQGVATGYLISMPLFTIIILLAPQIALSTVFQKSDGVPFTTGEMIGPVAGFVLLGLIAIWLLVSLLRAFSQAG
jgi:hypothetical protein